MTTHDTFTVQHIKQQPNLPEQQQVEWSRVAHSIYLIHQHFRYEYPGPIDALRQRLLILPPESYADQRRLDYLFTTSSTEAEIVYEQDVYGNQVINLSVPQVADVIDFEAWIVVERVLAPATWISDSEAWREPWLLAPSALTRFTPELVEIATGLRATGLTDERLARHINDQVYGMLQYAHDVTSIHTTASEALQFKYGVCQDYAHVMLALCRLCELPARYVSGHLLGEGGTHAWVEVLLPDERRPGMTRIMPLDPTHGREARINYITVAVGRDYYDVAPTSGTYIAAYSGQLSAYKHVGLKAYRYTDVQHATQS